MELGNKSAVVTGGSRGLGLGVVEALVRRGAKVTVVARGADDLAAVRNRLGVSTVSADITDESAARRILAETSPDLLVLNAGAKPPMGRLDQFTWEDFSAPWNTDVKAGLHWLKAALTLPLKRDARVLVTSSGAVYGSPLSGGYGGAKRMLWLMAKYAQNLANEQQLGIRFQVLVLQQMVAGTGVGDAASSAYARVANITPAEFLARFGAALPPAEYGERVVSFLNDPAFATAFALGLKGETGISVLEEVAA